MRRTSRVALSLLLTCATITPASATIWIFHGNPTCGQESPATPSAGTGSVSIYFDDVANTITYDLFFAGLTGNTTMAHIHLRPDLLTANGPVATTVPSLPGFPIGVTSGSLLATFDLTMASTYNPAFLNNATNAGSTTTAEATLLTALIDGRGYFNIHSSVFPGGEIRADMKLVPEPSTWMMMLGGFAAVGLAIRRRRKAALATA